MSRSRRLIGRGWNAIEFKPGCLRESTIGQIIQSSTRYIPLPKPSILHRQRTLHGTRTTSSLNPLTHSSRKISKRRHSPTPTFYIYDRRLHLERSSNGTENWQMPSSSGILLLTRWVLPSSNIPSIARCKRWRRCSDWFLSD
jgi:hypothetical protein